MKRILLFALVAMATATTVSAQESNSSSLVVAVSPNHRYEVVTYYGDFRIRDTRTKQLLENPPGVYFDLYEPANRVENTAMWSPDSRKVVLSYTSSKHGGGDCVIVALQSSKLTLLHLPADAIPIKWTGVDTLLCTVRTEAILTLDPKTGSFTRRQAKPSNK